MNKFSTTHASSVSRVKRAAAALALALPLCAAVGTVPNQAFAQSGMIYVTASKKTKMVKVEKSIPKTIRTDTSFADIVVGDPEVAVVNPLTDRSFYVVGTRHGTTGIALYNDANELVGMLDIQVGPNTNALNKTLKKALPKSHIKATSSNGRVVLSGRAKSSVAAAKARNIAKHYDEDLIDSVSVNGSQQVKLEVRFIEAERSKSKELGINLNGIHDHTRFSTGSYLLNGGTSLVSGSVPFGRIIGTLIDNGMQVDVLVDALEKRGVARRLAEPNLVALSGDTASFLAGGEFPIPVGADDGEVTIEFKRFGVGLEFTPTVLDNGLINLKIAPEVSQLDNTTTVKFNGIEIPGLVVRRAETTAELRDGQSFVIAGLLQSDSSYDLRKLPWLADIPILGALFRSSSFRKKQTDLVIIVTPRLVQPVAPGTRIATPLDQTAPASDVDLFVRGKTEVNRAHMRKIAAAKEGVLRTGHVITLD